MIITSNGKARYFTKQQKSLREIALDEISQSTPSDFVKEFGDLPIAEAIDKVTKEVDQVINQIPSLKKIEI